MSSAATLRDLVTLRWRGAAGRRKARRLDFFVVGVQKGGTTTIDRVLRRHPGIELPSSRKELHYFDEDERFDGLAPRDGYAALQAEFHFDRPLAGEVTPCYVYWPGALERIRTYNPEARIVVLLRNPVLRAYSHWGHLERKARRAGKGGVTSFIDRLAREGRARQRRADHHDKGLSHIGRSLYAPQIVRLRTHFPADHLLFIKSEALFADQDTAIVGLCRFLGTAPPAPTQKAAAVHANAGSARPISREDWEAAYPFFADDIEATEALLGWDCADWRSPPRERSGTT